MEQGALERYLPATRTDTDNPADTVADTDDAHDDDTAADCTVALAAAETAAAAAVAAAAVAAGIAVPDAAAAAAADDDGAGDTRHDCNHPYHNEVTFTVHGLERILNAR